MSHTSSSLSNPHLGNAADAAIEDYLAAADRVVETTRAERNALFREPLEKEAAIRRLLNYDNTLTSKPHSASSAEKVVEADPIYARVRAELTEAVVARIAAEAQCRAALCAVEARLLEKRSALRLADALDL